MSCQPRWCQKVSRLQTRCMAGGIAQLRGRYLPRQASAEHDRSASLRQQDMMDFQGHQIANTANRATSDGHGRQEFLPHLISSHLITHNHAGVHPPSATSLWQTLPTGAVLRYNRKWKVRHPPLTDRISATRSPPLPGVVSCVYSVHFSRKQRSCGTKNSFQTRRST
jgi:hypothetical protein